LIGKDSEPDPYLIQIDPDPNPGGPKLNGSYGSRSGTLVFI